jgi:hypothetical protein
LKLIRAIGCYNGRQFIKKNIEFKINLAEGLKLGQDKSLKIARKYNEIITLFPETPKVIMVLALNLSIFEM